MKAQVKTRTRVTRNCEIRLNRRDILEAVRQELKAQGNAQAIPDNAEIEFFVPGGADWSNISIDIDDENPVVISWTEEEANDD